MFVTLCILAAGCGSPETLKVASGKDVPAEFERLQGLLSPGDAAGSDEAFDTLVAIIEEESHGDETLFNAKMLDHFNGKSVQAVIAEYRRLDRAVVAKHAPAVEAKRTKREEEAAERMNKRINEEAQQLIQRQIDALDKLQKK